MGNPVLTEINVREHDKFLHPRYRDDGYVFLLLSGKRSQHSPHDFPPIWLPMACSSALCSDFITFPALDAVVFWFLREPPVFHHGCSFSFLFQSFICGFTVNHVHVRCKERRAPYHLTPLIGSQRCHPAVRGIDKCPLNGHRTALHVQHRDKRFPNP